MNIAFAPLEGITTTTYRKVFRRHFAGIDVYYTPFLAANASHSFKTRDKKEFLPYDDALVPQVLTSSANDFLWAAQVISDAGYEEINLNTGCPSPTVVTKHKGAGMLADKEALDEFWYSVFSSGIKLPKISVKTRIGASHHDEIHELISIWKKYPLSEIIVHPRAGTDLYEGICDIAAFRAVYDAFEGTGTPVTYNGDIRSESDVETLKEQIPGLSRIMIGRGMLIDPFLAERICGNDISGDDGASFSTHTIYDFLDDLWNEYEAILSGPRDILFKMKELWSWLGLSFPNSAADLKVIRKTRDVNEYKAAVQRVLM